jgi:hypothetical protein
MTLLPQPVTNVGYHVEMALAVAGPGVGGLARAGYAAKGVVYSLVGLLAVLAAWGQGGETTGTKGAMHNLMSRPFGVVMVGLLAVGLAGYALWCIVQAVADPEYAGTDGKGIAKRAFRAFKGVVHLSLVVAAVGMVTGRGGGNDGESNIDRWTAWLMSWPMGVWMVGIVGLYVVGYGAWQLIRAWRVKIDRMLALGQLPADARRTVIHVSRFGIGARGVVFGVIGVGLVVAARHANPAEARGVGGSLDWLAQQAYGKWLLTVVAAGLMAYGFYEFVRARYRVIRARK